MSLSYIQNTPPENCKHLLILLHGYGSNEEDLFSFNTHLPKNLNILSLQAPLSLPFGGYAWYSIHFDNSDGKFSDDGEAIEAREKIAALIEEKQKEFSILPENTFLLGFSQGAILSYAVALSYPEKVKNIIALSGYINTKILASGYEENDFSGLHFFASHGTDDQTIPVDWARPSTSFLEKLNIQHLFKEYPCGHQVSQENFFDFKTWMEELMDKIR